jgi:mono/diheme cytochrome c family protein
MMWQANAARARSVNDETSEEFVMKQPLFSEDAAMVRLSTRSVTSAVSASALIVACSFGTVDDGGTAESPAPPRADAVPEMSDTSGEAPDVAAQPEPSSSAPEADEPPYDPDADPFTTPLGQQVRSILETSCGSCHLGIGAKGDFGYLLDIAKLVLNEKVVPGNKSESQIYVRMLDGTMPPADQRPAKTPTSSQIDLVGKFIDELTLDGPDGDCQPLPFVDVDTQIELMQADMASRDETEKPFTRYLTVTYSSNAGDCGTVLERQRHALFKGINSVSTATTVTRPAAIDPDETIYRIDIRDYDWDRPIDLADNDISDPANIDFSDGWEALIANPSTAAYAVEYQGDAADDLAADAGTRVPFMPVNAFIQATEFGDLYYTLIGGRANLFEFEREVLRIDTVAETADNRLMRAGFANSGVSQQERVLNRFDSGVAAGLSYWISFDFDGGNGGAGVNGFERNTPNESIFANPLEFGFAGGEAIFSLPNGMQAYYVANGAGDRLATAPVGVVIDPAQNNGLVTNGASCPSCHNAGLISFTDAVRRYVQENRVRFDNETFENVMQQYPDSAAFNRQIALDSAVHIEATERAGVPRRKADPVSRVYLDFQRINVDLRIAAGELGVEPEVLIDSIDLLDARLANLTIEGGYVGREIMDDTFLDSVCILHGVQENTPVGCE